jgi:phosphoenolpyruvate-protein phosphotransferase
MADERQQLSDASVPRVLQGLGVSPGKAIGPALVYRRAMSLTARALAGPPPSSTDPLGEMGRVDAALAQAAAALRALAVRVEREAGPEEAGIFEAQALMLEDPTLAERAHVLIETEGQTSAQALIQAAEEQAAALERLPDPLWKARAADVRDAANRALAVLAPGGATDDLGSRLRHAEHPVVLVTDDLTPSDTAQMPHEMVVGIGTAAGSATAHAAILARAYGIPAVAGLGEALFSAIYPGDTVALDGNTGTVVVRPDADFAATFQREATAWSERASTARHAARQAAQRPGQTRDGLHVAILANVGGVAQAREAAEMGAEGIGLLRTEFLFAERTTLPTEHEQAALYAAIVSALAAPQAPIVVRTLDAGNDKPLPSLAEVVRELPREDNPALGIRGIRLHAAYPALLRDQLAALLRAAAATGGNLHIMLPMVSTVEEVRLARSAYQEAALALAAEGVRLERPLPLGIMVETPAAVLNADALAREAEFFSVGTNDLAQYVMASDRLNPRLAALTDARQPAVLHAIAQAARAGQRARRTVAVCGEMAADPSLASLLVGLGVTELSMAPASIPAVKQALAERTIDELRALADRALACATVGEVREVLHAYSASQ